MAELAVPALAVVLVVAAWFSGLILLDVFTARDVRAWRRLARLRGYTSMRGRLERAVSRAPAVRRLQEELDLQRLLAVAQRPERPLGFLGRTLAASLLVLAAVLLADAAARAVAGAWPLPPWVALLLAATVPAVALLDLGAAARRAQERCGRTLTDMVMMLAVITDARGFQLDEAVRMMSRCASDPALRRLIDEGGHRRLVAGRTGSTVELYRCIADAYGIAELRLLAEAAAAANVGTPERDVYTKLAIAMYQDRLASARLRAARARTLVTLPVAGMLVPLLLLIGAPTLAAVSSGLTGG